MDQVGELGENRFSSIHFWILAQPILGENPGKISSRLPPFTRGASLYTRTVVPHFRTFSSSIFAAQLLEKEAN